MVGEQSDVATRMMAAHRVTVMPFLQMLQTFMPIGMMSLIDVEIGNGTKESKTWFLVEISQHPVTLNPQVRSLNFESYVALANFDMIHYIYHDITFIPFIL